LLDRFGAAVRLQESLARYTVARLGGPADALIEAVSVDQLAEVLTICWQYHLPARIIGGGANVLIADTGYRGVMVINQAKGLQLDAVTGIVQADSGVGLIQLARETIMAGLSGFEWAIGVPGTVGGAVVNNAGAHGRDMAANVHSVDVLLSPGIREQWPVETLDYRYRESALKHRSADQPAAVVLHAELHFAIGHDPAILRANADEYQAQRKRSQPPGASLGSMFKNPPGDYAGRLIEQAGLKGTKSGGVQISPIHGNFFVNVGGGTASDYLALIALAQTTVSAQFGVTLELEVELIG
jgi:UDP-N-acetylmuramate dehydrogenase